MIQEIKIYTAIAAKSGAKWLVVAGFGFIITITLFLIVLFENTSGAGGGHGNAIAFITNLMTTNWAAFLVLAGAPIFLILYVIIANKYASQTAFFLIWKNKAGGFVSEKIKQLIDTIVDKNKSAATITDGSILKLQLLEANRTHPDSSKIKRKAVDYFIKKIQLDDIDYTNKDLRLGDIVATKAINYVDEATEPSLRLFWILLLVQLFLFIISQIL